MSNYKEKIIAKDGNLVPVFNNGQLLYSKYNTEKDTEIFFQSIQKSENLFIVIGGIGSALHIDKLINCEWISKIIAIENDIETLTFCRKNFAIEKIEKNPKVIFSTIDNLQKIILENYNPIFYGDFSFITLRSWANNNQEDIIKIQQIIADTLDIVGSDFSTQAQFGRLWHRNIFQNLLLAEKISHVPTLPNPKHFEGVFIAAAGPSLDKEILKLKKTQKHWFVISTDTALSSLQKNGIIPQITITIDGQNISRRHFMHNLSNKMILVADLSSSPVVTRRALQKDVPIIFTINNHPLSQLINQFQVKNKDSTLTFLNTGAGTVTSAALDFANKMGFTNIWLAGCDFAYIDGKPYAKGTYFDDIFGYTQTRLNPIETSFSNLMLNNELIYEEKNKITTKRLQAYKKTFEKYLSENTTKQHENKIKYFSPKKDSYKSFINWYLTNLSEKEPFISTIIPLAAWKMKKNKSKNDFFSLIKLAYSLTVRYTNSHGK